MANTESMRDERGNVRDSQTANTASALRPSPTVAGRSAVGPQGYVREDAAERHGIGWLMIVLVFFCMMIVPFAIGAIVLFVQ